MKGCSPYHCGIQPNINHVRIVTFMCTTVDKLLQKKMQGSPDAGLRLACCTSQVKRWSEAMDFLQSLLQNKYFLPKMELLQNFCANFYLCCVVQAVLHLHSFLRLCKTVSRKPCCWRSDLILNTKIETAGTIFFQQISLIN